MEDNLTSADPLSYTTTIMIPGRANKIDLNRTYLVGIPVKDIGNIGSRQNLLAPRMSIKIVDNTFTFVFTLHLCKYDHFVCIHAYAVAEV